MKMGIMRGKNERLEDGLHRTLSGYIAGGLEREAKKHFLRDGDDATRHAFAIYRPDGNIEVYG